MKKQMVGTVITLFVSVDGSSVHLEKEHVVLDEKGIKGDKYYDTNIQRSVLITSLASYTLVNDHNIEMPYGSLGENLLIDFNPYHLTAGDKLQIGGVILQISQNCTMCDHLSKIDEQLPILLKDDRGIFAKVIQGGEIKKEDEIFLL
ncbi:MOSC domain-containing protein [Sulfurovum sp.]|uniref:MOSC domain-containing protein n=1 Tax=Sulfurovum sp. TaxID=1969726 RepID=UPI002867C9BE|nr:MOSC domain-containing protein [Sulfurovum sp.]